MKIFSDGKLRKNIPTIIVLLAFTTLFFVNNIIRSDYKFNFDVNNIVYSINLEEIIEKPFTENDLDTALQKINDVGLSSIASRTTFTLANIENNQQVPNAPLNLTEQEFTSILVPMYYTKYDKTIRIYEISCKNSNLYSITVTFGKHLNYNYSNLKINETIYVYQFYEIDETFNIVLVGYKFLNVNPDFVKKTDINEYAKDDDIGEFLKFVFTKKENSKTFIELLNYTNFSLNDEFLVIS